jgi:hypothetical protein
MYDQTRNPDHRNKDPFLGCGLFKAIVFGRRVGAIIVVDTRTGLEDQSRYPIVLLDPAKVI